MSEMQQPGRRIAKTRAQRLAAPRQAIGEDLLVHGTYWITDSGFWGWKANNGKQGLARTAREARESCCAA